MTSPDEWVSAYLDGSLTDSEAQALNDWVKASPANARQFTREALVHSHLRDALVGARSLELTQEEINSDLDLAADKGPEPRQVDLSDAIVMPALRELDESAAASPEAEPPPPFVASDAPAWPRRRIGRRAAIVLLPLMLGLGLWQGMRWRHQTDARGAPAMLSEALDADWAAPYANIRRGDPMPTAPLYLKSGVAQVRFGSGASIILQAPARFQVTADNGADLDFGRLTARAPGEAHGFSIHTPDARIVDLGTEFGVEVAEGGKTRVEVFQGTVEATPRSASAGASQILKQEEAADVTASAVTMDPGGIRPQQFVRSLTTDVASLDVVDLVAGGDGTTQRRGRAIDQLTGASGPLPPKGQTKGDRIYHSVSGLPVVDGCFVPNGPGRVDSAGHTFNFPVTDGDAFNQIWASNVIPWPNDSYKRLNSEILGSVDYSKPGHGLLLMHSNSGLTFDLSAIRRLHPRVRIADFRCVAGNSRTEPYYGSKPKADIFVMADGALRFQRRGFIHDQGPFDIHLNLSDGDRFLTIAVTDGGDHQTDDWIILGDPALDLSQQLTR